MGKIMQHKVGFMLNACREPTALRAAVIMAVKKGEYPVLIIYDMTLTF